MKKYNYSIIVICSFLIGSLFAQNTGSMQSITIPDGLSNTNVQSIYEDRFGYIWIMTMDGLNRYDGNKIKIYRNDPDDPNSLSANTTFCAEEDKDGYLWIGGINVANRYDYATDSFKSFRLTSAAGNENGQRVISLFSDSEGRIWAGTMGGTIHRFFKETQTFNLIYHSNNIDSKYAGEVWCITQLKNGKILFSNQQQGIYQYDESSDKLTDFFLDKDFSPKKIIRIQEDDDGSIWFSGSNIIIKYNPNFYSYEILKQFQILPQIYHLGFHKVSDDNYLFISEPFGLMRYNPKTNKIVETIPTELAPYWFITDKFGIIWIAAHGGVIKYDPQTMPIQSLHLISKTTQDNHNISLTNIQFDNMNMESIWALSTDNNLIHYNLNNGSIKHISFTPPYPYKDLLPGNFTKDRENNFYLSVNNHSGIIKYNLNKKEASEITNLPYVLNQRTEISDLVIDQNNNLILATNLGVIFSELARNNQIIIPSIANQSYPLKTQKIVQDAIKDATQIALITKANENEKYSIDFSLDKETKVLIHCMGEGRLDEPAQQMFDYGILRSEDGNIIFGMQDFLKTRHAGGGLKNRREYAILKLQPGNYNLKYTMDSGHSYPDFNTTMPSDSALYGIQVYGISDNNYTTLEKIFSETDSDKALSFEGANDIEISRKYGNSIYISSFTQGLFRYNLTDKSFTHYTFGELNRDNSKNVVQSCYEDITGNVWVSTKQGLILLNPGNGKWRVFTEKDGLPSNTILNTIEDNSGNLWILSLGGISKFNKNEPADKWNFVNYDTRDGLSGYSFKGNPLRTPDGKILFIVGDVVHSFLPGTSNPVKPNVVINDFKISDVSVFSPDSPIRLEKSLMETKNINLSYGLNDLSFNFSVIHYARPYKNKIFYKLEGFNQDWLESELGTATFTNLDPGNYEFKVRGISADGLQNEKDTSIKINITPPWWRTTAAYIGYILLLGLIIFAMDRFQRRRLLAKERSATAIREAELRAQLAEAENERQTKELEEARQLQLSMLPKELPKLPHLDIAVYMKTATEVGGDYYDFHVGMDGTLTVVIGDATGHGMKAGTMVTTAKSLFNSYAPNPDILYSFSEITRCIKQMNMGKMSMCMTMLKIQDSRLKMSSAGMPPSFIFRRDTRIVEEHLMQGVPLGTMNKFSYKIIDTKLKPGDTILLLTDGLPELQNDNEELFGYKRVRNIFEEIAEKSPEEIINQLKEDGSDWVSDKDPEDDVTFVVIKVK